MNRCVTFGVVIGEDVRFWVNADGTAFVVVEGTKAVEMLANLFSLVAISFCAVEKHSSMYDEVIDLQYGS